jgi:hypothetical protein
MVKGWARIHRTEPGNLARWLLGPSLLTGRGSSSERLELDLLALDHTDGFDRHRSSAGEGPSFR